MDRLIIESTEGRITLGIVMFVAIMILVGWIAINEEGRMAEFEEQHIARSIERGAELFASNCSPCHGNNGYGIGGRAPALNNPHLFGYDYLADVNGQIASLERELADFEGVEGLRNAFGIPDQAGTIEVIETRRQELLDQIADASEEEARDLLVEVGHIDARLSDNAEQVMARIEAIEAGEPLEADNNPELTDRELDERLSALQENIPIIQANNELLLNGDGTDENPGLYAQREALLEDLTAAIQAGYLPQLDVWRANAEEFGYPLFLTDYIATDANRLSQIEFGGSVEGYITTTLIHGRPGSGDVWNGNIMVAWSQRAGGPLRDDQIGDLVAFITNWDKGDNWTLDDFNAVAQYAILHTAYTGEPTSDVPSVGTTVSQIVEDLPEGDATRGEALYNSNEASELGIANLGCTGCHLGGTVGPDTEGTWTRIQQQRLPELEGYTGVQYLVESIVAPNAYVVPGYSSNVMNPNYGDQLSIQDLADIVAYIQTQNQ